MFVIAPYLLGVCCLAGDGTSVAESGEAKAVAARSELVYFDFDETPWNDVLEWLSQVTGRSLQLDMRVGGTFSYRDARGFTAEEALDLVHSMLLDRGITLIDEGNSLQVVLLADEYHVDLVPFVPVKELANCPDSKIVWTKVPITSLSASRLADELEPLISARGKIVGVSVGNRLLICDQVVVIRRLLRLIEEFEPETGPNTGRFRTFRLKHASADRAAEAIRELVGYTGSAAPAQPIIDFEKMGRELGSRGMLEAFIPGFSMKGFVPDAPRIKVATRIAVDYRHNAVLVAGEPSVIAVADEVVKQIDIPVADPSESKTTPPPPRRETPIAPLPAEPSEPSTLDSGAITLTVIPVAAGTVQDARRLATRLAATGGQRSTPIITGDEATKLLFIRATQSQADEIRDMLRRLGFAR